jgi:hypothetical protein
MDVIEIGWKGLNWNDVAQNGPSVEAFANAVMKLLLP